MTDQQFWMKADQISDSRKTIEEKSEALAVLLQTASKENLKMVVIFQEGDHHVYLNLDDEHPNTIGNRTLLCYTSKRKAQSDFRARMYGMKWGYLPVQDVLNNLFNKAVIGSLTFNCYSMDAVISVMKETLMKYIPGPYPVPTGFVDVPVSGYPVIPKNVK